MEEAILNILILKSENIKNTEFHGKLTVQIFSKNMFSIEISIKMQTKVI